MLTINEPACESGGIVIAVAQTLAENEFSYANKALVVDNDIDLNCVLISYLQISYTGIPP